MYRTRPLGFIFDEDVHDYRPLYQAIPLGSTQSPKNLLVKNQEPANFANHQRTIERNNVQPPNSIVYSPTFIQKPTNFSRCTEIDARIKSPSFQNASKLTFQKTNQNIFSGTPPNIQETISHVHPPHITQNYNRSPRVQQTEQIREIRKIVNQYSRVNKSYEEPETQLSDANPTAIFALNSAIRELTSILKEKKSTEVNASVLQRHYLKNARDINQLEIALQKKTNQIADLKNLLEKQRINLTTAHQTIQSNELQFKKQEEYGYEARKKLRIEIDSLKKSYYQLVGRVEGETASESPSEKNQYKELYEQTHRELEEYKKKNYRESFDTETFQINIRKEGEGND